MDDDDMGAPRWDELDKIKGASHEAYLMNQKITSETFRHKFLDYNRPWLVAQLPNILTPRTLRRSRPYLTAQLTKILGSVNPDVSSDDEEDDSRPRFGPVTLTNASRNIIRLWLAQARRRRTLRAAVQPLINRARKVECEQCLSRKQLQVELLTPIDKLGDAFEQEHPSEEFDQVAWKNYFQKHAVLRTLCLPCVQKHRDEQKVGGSDFAARGAPGRRRGVGGPGDYEGGPGAAPDRPTIFGPVVLSAASKAIMLHWLHRAQESARKRGVILGIRAADISDDDDDDDKFDNASAFAGHRLNLSPASVAIMRRWLILGRERMAADGRGPNSATLVKKRKKKAKAKNIFGF